MTINVDVVSDGTIRHQKLSSPLAMSANEFRAACIHTAELAADYYAHRPENPTYTAPAAEALYRIRKAELPEYGLGTAEILDHFARDIMPLDMGNQLPTFSAWVNPAAAPISMLVDHLAGVMNPTSAKGLHAATEVETLVIRWIQELIGFPTENSGGIFVNGGSLANVHGLAAALHRASTTYGWDLAADGLQGGHPQLVLYGSNEVHTCVEKAVRLLGLGTNAYRRIAVDQERRIDLVELRHAIGRDRAAGRRPFAIVASAGTVNTGVVDPLGPLADICAAEDLWLHVDGAYGWPGFLDDRIAHRYGDGLTRADSIALDGHKWLAATNTCSCVLVRDKTMLAGAFSFVADYLRLPEDEGFGTGERFDMLGMYQTRHFLAAKLYGVLLRLGRAGIREHVTRHIDLAQYMMNRIQQDPELELMTDTDLTVVCFRYLPAEPIDSQDDLDQINREVVRRVMLGGRRAFISGTQLHGRYAIRSCALHYNLNRSDVDTMLEVVREEGKLAIRP